MFKPLIKKVREESSNTSVLPENNTDELNNNLNKENNTNIRNENSLPSTVQRRSSSISQSNQIIKLHSTSTSVDSEIQDEIIKPLSDILSSYIQEPITISNYAKILQSWIDSKEELLRQRDITIDNALRQTTELRTELNLLRNRFSDLQLPKEKATNKIPYLQRQIDSLEAENENLKSTIRNLRTQLSTVENERDDLIIKSTDVSHMKINDELKKQVDMQIAENKQHTKEIEKLREAIVERDIIIEQQDKRLLVEHDSKEIQTDEDRSFVQVFAEPDVDTLGKLQAELDEKNRLIKTLQQRYNDLRKTLQREFHASIPKDLNQMGSVKTTNNGQSPLTNHPLIHYDASSVSQSDVESEKRSSISRQMVATRKNVTFTTTPLDTASPAILPHTSIDSMSTKTQKNGQHLMSDGQTPLNSTNFKYLKHVVFKFMTSTEDEAIHLIRAVSTLLHFSADEEQFLRETLDYKMSWFGKVTRPKPISSNSNF